MFHSTVSSSDTFFFYKCYISAGDTLTFVVLLFFGMVLYFDNLVSLMIRDLKLLKTNDQQSQPTLNFLNCLY